LQPINPTVTFSFAELAVKMVGNTPNAAVARVVVRIKFLRLEFIVIEFVLTFSFKDIEICAENKILIFFSPFRCVMIKFLLLAIK